jgi:hypothetical protein
METMETMEKSMFFRPYYGNYGKQNSAFNE